MFLEQIERKSAQLQKVVNVFREVRVKSLEEYRSQSNVIDDHKTMGIKLSGGVRKHLEKVARKYNLGKSRKKALLLVIHAGCQVLLSTEELALCVEDVEPETE